jgi:hypothetical protein
MWSRALYMSGTALAVAAVGVGGYLIGSRRPEQDEEAPGMEPSPSKVRQDVMRKLQRVGSGAIIDYADVHGTELAQAVNRLRKNLDNGDAMAEARLQHEVLGALLDELTLRQDAAV